MAPKKVVAKVVAAKAASPEEKVPELKAATPVEKRKAEETPEEPAAKKEAKTEEEELEKDGAEDKRPALKVACGFNNVDCTLNVVPTLAGKVLMGLNEGGMQYLIAGARSNVGIKGGRYMYEVKIIEALNPTPKVPAAKQLVRLGFSTAGSPLVLGDADTGVYFDSDGGFAVGHQRKGTSQRFGRDQSVAVLLNLDAASPNANTVSLFCNGKRISKPQPLPESLHGKALFPHIAFRAVSLQVNMGPVPAKALPFSCRMVQGAATADAVVADAAVPKDGKYEVLVPVAFPDEGTFQWLDDFLEKNPTYVELSDRKLQDWAASSGLAKPRGGTNDKPAFAYGVPGMDDMSLRNMIASVAPIMPRNYVVMEVKSNLIAAERSTLLKRFSKAHFKKVAHVVMGEPSKEHKKKVHSIILKAKQDKANTDWRLKKAEKERKKQLVKRQKELAELRKQAEEKRKQMVEEAKKKAEEAKKKAEAGDEKKEEAASVEVEAPAKVEEKKEEEPEEVDDLGEEPPTAELSAEEQKLWFQPKVGAGDLAPAVLSKAFASFTIPEKEEGFDAINYEWQQEAKSKEYLRKWVVETKLTSRIEDLQPSQYFKDKAAAWQKQFGEWQTKQRAFKAAAPKKKEEISDGAKDISSVEDVSDIGGGEPLFAHFAPEDWALIQLRHELYLLQDAFQKDVNDPDRAGIPENHLAFYYNKYFKKGLNPKLFSLSTNLELFALLKDTVAIPADTQVLTSQLPAELESLGIFVKLTEENRRERQRRIDAGDETARLKFVTVPAAVIAPAKTVPAVVKGAGKGKGKGKW